MRKIAFFCIPAHGHTNPTLGVVRELVRRGHQVRYYSFDLMREKIEAAGAEFVSCEPYMAEPDLDKDQQEQVGNDIALAARLLVDTTLALDEMISSQLREWQPDCIVADSMALWGKAAARKLNVPFVSSTTTFAFNRYSARVMKGSLGDLLGLLLKAPRANREIRRLRDRGYPIKSFMDILQNDDSVHTVVYTSPEFQPCSDTFSDKYVFVGPSVRPAETELEQSGKKLIYISMGTVVSCPELYRNCVQALRDLDCQVIFSLGDHVQASELGQLPDHMKAYPRVDQMAVLARADLFLTHCGMNSVNESLWSSVPMVLFPRTREQEGVANRTEELGAGLRLEETSPEAIRAAVERVLNDPSYRENAHRLGRSFRDCPGAAGAADKILSVCRA